MKKKTDKISKEFAKELIEKAKKSTSFQQILDKAKIEFSAVKSAR